MLFCYKLYFFRLCYSVFNKNITIQCLSVQHTPADGAFRRRHGARRLNKWLPYAVTDGVYIKRANIPKNGPSICFLWLCGHALDDKPPAAWQFLFLRMLGRKNALIIAADCSIISFSFVMDLMVHSKAALVGELAVPSTCNPLQQG